MYGVTAADNIKADIGDINKPKFKSGSITRVVQLLYTIIPYSLTSLPLLFDVNCIIIVVRCIARTTYMNSIKVCVFGITTVPTALVYLNSKTHREDYANSTSLHTIEKTNDYVAPNNTYNNTGRL